MDGILGFLEWRTLLNMIDAYHTLIAVSEKLSIEVGVHYRFNVMYCFSRKNWYNFSEVNIYFCIFNFINLLVNPPGGLLHQTQAICMAEPEESVDGTMV